ncbi:sensor histidine kinase [Clostridium weizhouense]|uniref:histidine kinase n=1 Tax=Clostridium weizhouense TaxID=2859781 RepID=A0ABS7AT54_9CLOT|nr:HAMP domain-containing sensor histidine kinase [Clostridium weizhouense]MBW6411850.1 HAMP domain-containing histidine kinase [Clostridium weizhouense]
MENYERIRNVTFINQKNVIKTCFLSVIFYCIMSLVFKGDYLTLILFFKTYYLIGGLAFVILLKPIAQMYNQHVIQKIYIFTYLTMLIYLTIFIKNMANISLKCNYDIEMDVFTNIIIFLEIFLSFMIIEYKVKKEKTNTKLYIILQLIIGSIFILFNKNLDSINLIFLFSIQIFFAVKSVKNIVAIKNKSNFNIIICYLLILSLIFITNILYNFNLYELSILIYLRELFILVSFNIFWNIFSTNLIKNPYKHLCKSLMKKNESLSNLSKDILVKNNQLEKSINSLKNKEYLYETFFRFMPHPLILVSTRNDRVLFTNKAFLELVNVSNIKEIINEKLSKYIYFVNSDEVKNTNFNAVLNAGSEDKFINAKFLPIYKDKMEDLILIEDNTSKVLTEEIKKEVQNRIIEEKIRTEFLSSISHDLKTPINVIYSATQLEKIYMTKKDVQALEKYNFICKKNCISLIRLTNNLIDSSKINSDYLMPSLENINVVDAVEDVVTSLVDYARSNNVQMIFNTNKEEIYLNLDFEFIQRIILNLISNSIKFTSKNGKINVNIEDTEDAVKISVIDNGVGMNKEFIKEAFCKYAMDKKDNVSSKNGTGIGLFVVKKLVELQNGTLNIETESGVGTDITMKFKKENNDE